MKMRNLLNLFHSDKKDKAFEVVDLGESLGASLFLALS